MQMEPIQQLEEILPATVELVDRLEPADMDRPTPCSEFRLVDVLEHMVTLGGSFAWLFRGEVPPEPSAPVRNGEVPAAEFRKAMEELLDAVHDDGAMERTIDSPVGRMLGEDFARLVAFDGLVHGWDIASSAGLGYHPSEDLVASVDSFARGAITPQMRDGDTFAGPTTAPAGASTLERLVAFSGREV
jgi:uncharacterized protein (TIGR03086 family)